MVDYQPIKILFFVEVDCWKAALSQSAFDFKQQRQTIRILELGLRQIIHR